MIINLKLNLGDGSLYGNAIINNKSFFKVNIQEGIDSSTIISNDLNVNKGQAMILFNTENGKLVQVRSDVRKEDTDMIQIFKFGYSSKVNNDLIITGSRSSFIRVLSIL